MVRKAAATIDLSPRGTCASKFLMKCTRQRCQVTPARTWASAFFRPSWASLVTNCTPFSPRLIRLRRKSSQKPSSSLAPRAKPHLSLAALSNAGGDDQRLAHDAMVVAHLQVERIQPDEGVLALQGAVAKRLHHFVELLADPGNAALIHPGQPQGLQQIIHPTGA